MVRRRRRIKESAYSADSFLDIICNLVYKYVGIVLIVLVLVAKQASLWPSLAALREGPTPDDQEEAVAVAEVPKPTAEVTPEPEAPSPKPNDPEAQALEREIAHLRGQLLDHLRSLDEKKSDAERARRQQAAIASQEADVRGQLAKLDAMATAERASVESAERNAKPLRQRLDELRHALEELKATPRDRKALRFQPPISKPVNSGELYFEVRNGRVTFIDLQELLDRVKASANQRADELRHRWQLEDQVGPVGSYAMKYILAREHGGGLDQAFANQPPRDGSFKYGVAEWEIVPSPGEHGETVSQALLARSQFRAVVDSLDVDAAVLTFFVYEDSFSAFRVLRDYLADRGFLVAGRPLLMDHPIGGSPQGTRTRAQ